MEENLDLEKLIEENNGSIWLIVPLIFALLISWGGSDESWQDYYLH